MTAERRQLGGDEPPVALLTTRALPPNPTSLEKMQPTPPSSGPTARGRFFAISLGIVLGGIATYYMMSDFELVRRLDDPAKPENRPFRVTFKQSEPLRLKPEAQARLDEAKRLREQESAK